MDKERKRWTTGRTPWRLAAVAALVPGTAAPPHGRPQRRAVGVVARSTWQLRVKTARGMKTTIAVAWSLVSVSDAKLRAVFSGLGALGLHRRSTALTRRGWGPEVTAVEQQAVEEKETTPFLSVTIITVPPRCRQ